MLKKLWDTFLVSGLKPIANLLKSKAVIRDYEKSFATLKTHLEKDLVELSTVMHIVDINWDEKYTQKIWDVAISSAEVEIKVEGYVRAGFDLKEHFELKFDHDRQKIIVVLPPPKIGPVDLVLEFKKLESGFFKKIGKDEITLAYSRIKEQARQEALSENILGKAKDNCHGIIKSLFKPILMATDQHYQIEVKFLEKKPEPIKSQPVRELPRT